MSKAISLESWLEEDEPTAFDILTSAQLSNNRAGREIFFWKWIESGLKGSRSLIDWTNDTGMSGNEKWE